MTNPALASFSDGELLDEMLARMGAQARAELLALPEDDPARIRWLEGRAALLDRLREGLNPNPHAVDPRLLSPS